MVDYTFSLGFSMVEFNSQVDRCISIRLGNPRAEPLHQANVVVRDGIEPSTFRFSVGASSVTVLHGEPVCAASDFCQLLTLFVVTPHCKNSNDPIGFQHLVDEAMLKIDAP